MIRRRGSFRGRVASITGGASGIGLAMGTALVEQGAHIVLADLDGERAERVACELADETNVTGSVFGVALDVRDRAAVKALVDEVAAREGRLDFMFNNAGIVIGERTR